MQMRIQPMQVGTEAGFTLIELMASMVIMAVGLFAVVHMQTVSIRGTSYSREMIEANHIAASVADELRARSLQWNAQATNSFTSVFPDIVLEPTPALGNDLAPNLLAQTTLTGLAISEDNNMTSAWPINGRFVAANGTMDSYGAIFRVHLMAYPMRLSPTDLVNLVNFSLVRVLIFVSWDNKNYGDQNYNWADWATPGTYWTRHMVSANVFLRRN